MRLNRSMKRSVGARADSASSTSLTMRAMVLSSAARVTVIRRAASVLIDPAKTGSPGPLVRGTDSPVTGLSSMPDVPSAISPSAGMRSPGRTSTRWPACKAAAGTSRVVPFSSSRAVFGTRSASALIEDRALLAATPSSTSPTANRKTTSAASSAAPMNRAPMAAMVISASIVKGMPACNAANACRAIGTTPITQAPMKAQPAMSSDASSLTAHAPARSNPVPITKRPLPVWNHALPLSAGSSCR